MDTAAATAAQDHAGALVERVQELQGALDAAPGSATRELAEELVACVVQMYGIGLERIVGALRDAGEEGERLAAELAEDALDSVRPYMESHGGSVELLSLEDGVARIHLRGSCSDCSASSVTLELAIKQALEEAAPDLEGLDVEGMAPQMPGVALPMADGAGAGRELPVIMSSPPSAPTWIELSGDVGGLVDGAMAAIATPGGELLVANVDGTLLAYRDACAGCGGALREGALA